MIAGPSTLYLPCAMPPGAAWQGPWPEAGINRIGRADRDQIPGARASCSRAGAGCTLERLDARRDRKLTLIQGPAGFGKTTPAIQWRG